MLLGARELRDKGCVLLFESRDLVHWKYKLRFTTETPFGYMWECPNYVEPQGQGYLICCPQGVEKRGWIMPMSISAVIFLLPMPLERKITSWGPSAN